MVTVNVKTTLAGKYPGRQPGKFRSEKMDLFDAPEYAGKYDKKDDILHLNAPPL